MRGVQRARELPAKEKIAAEQIEIVLRSDRQRRNREEKTDWQFMKDNETRTKFIELRAQGVSLRKIAEELKISPGTACDWAARYKKKIKNLKMLEMEAIQERYLAKYEEELEDLMEEFRRIKAELSNRSFEYLSTPFLLQHKGTLLSRMDKKRTRAEFEETGDE